SQPRLCKRALAPMCPRALGRYSICIVVDTRSRQHGPGAGAVSNVQGSESGDAAMDTYDVLEATQEPTPSSMAPPAPAAPPPRPAPPEGPHPPAPQRPGPRGGLALTLALLLGAGAMAGAVFVVLPGLQSVSPPQSQPTPVSPLPAPTPPAGTPPVVTLPAQQ